MTQFARISPDVFRGIPADIILTNFPFIPFFLTIDSLDPSEPLENRPVQINFTLSNYSGTPASGDVTSELGGTYAIDNLANGASISGHINSAAPSAGKGVPLSLQFFKHPIPPGVEFPSPDAEGQTVVDVAARYMLSLDSFDIGRTRAVHNDTDYVSMAAQIGGQEPLSKTQFIGDVNDGHHVVNIQLGPFDSIPNGSPDLVFSYTIANQGHNGTDAKTVEEVTNGISNATKAVLTYVYPAWKSIWEIADKLTQYLNGFFVGIIFADCDGVVAADRVSVPSTTLYQWTSAINSHSQKTHYDGTDSAVGCGRNSSYYVTWTVTRVVRD